MAQLALAVIHGSDLQNHSQVTAGRNGDGPEIAKARVEQRIARGGHGVSGGTIERRFNTSKENFLRVYPYCDSIIIYDNTEQMTCVASIKNGKLDLMQEVLWVNELLSGLDLE